MECVGINEVQPLRGERASVDSRLQVGGRVRDYLYNTPSSPLLNRKLGPDRGMSLVYLYKTPPADCSRYMYTLNLCSLDIISET